MNPVGRRANYEMTLLLDSHPTSVARHLSESTRSGGLHNSSGAIFADHLPDWSRGTLDNGMAAGGIVAMVLTLQVSLKQRAQRDVLEPSVRSLPKLRAVLDRAAERAGWDEVAINRLQGMGIIQEA